MNNLAILIDLAICLQAQDHRRVGLAGGRA
jgi:hypothetical protein